MCPPSRVANLTSLHREHLYGTLVKQGGRKGQPLSPKTVRRVHQVIQKALTASPSTGSGTPTPPTSSPWARTPRMVSERLGHADVAFTLQVYGHVLPGHQREAAEAAAGWWTRTTSTFIAVICQSGSLACGVVSPNAAESAGGEPP